MISDKSHVLDSSTFVTGVRKAASMKRWMLTVGSARLTRVVVLSLLLLWRPSYAATFTELGDTGNLPATAQITSVIGLLTEIDGTLSPANGDAQDMYLIHIDGGGTFSATTVGGVGFDSQLFLFDASGKGVYANDDVIFRDFAPSTLPAGNPLTPITAGNYYLAITQCCSVPISSGGQIFTIAGPNHRAVSGPTGAGGDSSVTGYSGGFVQIPTMGGSYRIFLTGTHAAVIPEPPAFALMLAGLGMIGLFICHQRSTKSYQASSI